MTIRLTKQLKRSLILVCLSTVFYSSVALANESTPDPNPKSEKRLGADNCPDTIEQYAQWRARALAIISNDNLKAEVYDWLLESGFKKGRGNIYKNWIVREESIKDIVGISVSCRVTTDSFQGVEGYITIVYKNETGIKRGYVLVDSVEGGYRIFGINQRFKQVVDGDKIENEADLPTLEDMPTHFYDEVDRLVPIYIQEIDEALGAKPNDLIFTDDEVDLFFDWPDDIEFTVTENVEVSGLRTGKEYAYHYSTKRRVSVEPHENGIRMSYLAEGAEYKWSKTQPPLPVDYKELVESCASQEQNDFEVFCLYNAMYHVPQAHTIDVFGNISRPIVDNQFAQELLSWIDMNMEGLKGKSTYRQKMEVSLNKYIEDGDYVTGSEPATVDFVDLHSKRFKRDEIVENVSLAYFYNGYYNLATLMRFREQVREARYLGPTQCNDADESKSCALLESHNIGTNPESESKVGITMSLVVEPHTLLPHSIQVVSENDEYDDGVSSPKKTSKVVVDVLFEYE